jgi:phage tail-like protein
MSTALPGLKSPQRQPAAHGVLTATLDGSLVHSMLITEKVIRIGRLPDNEFVLPHPTVSRHHAEVRIQNGQVVLTDVGSSAGTTVGGVRLSPNQPVLLEPGGDVRIGPFALKYTPPAPAQPILPGVPAEPPRGPSGPLVPPEAIEELLAPPGARPVFPAPLPEAPPGRYLANLPAMFQEDGFLGRFLQIFESVWEPLEWRQDHFELYFDPRTCPAGYLAFLAGWLDLTVNPHWPEDRRRRLLDEAMELYRWRGTPYGLSRMIEVCTGRQVEISESDTQPFTFRVRLPASSSAGERELIEQLLATHKPAHVGYLLEIGA